MARTYLIIGTGAAAVAGACAIKETDPAGNITLIGEDSDGFYSRPALAYYLSGEVSERQLILHAGEPFRHLKKRVVAVHPGEHRVVTEDRSSYHFDRLLLATGATATRITNPGADLKGVVKLDSMEDARRIVKLMRRGSAGVVVGGGITALEFVEALVTRGMETHYLLRGDRYWPNVLDEVESRIVEARLKSHGVQIHFDTQLAKITGHGDRVTGVETEDGKQIDCRLVAVAIGVQPRLELARSAGLKTDRGILTDEFLQTSSADVFAAGDAAQVLDPVSGKTVLDTLWGMALAQGRAAGRNMAGAGVPYVKGVSFNVTRLAGLTTTIIGAVGKGDDIDLVSITRGESETWRLAPNVMAVQREFDFNRTRLLVGPKAIVGAVVMGDQTLSRPLQQLITGKVDITSIRERLLEPGAPVSDIITQFWSTGGIQLETAQL